MSTITENIEMIRERMTLACRRAGRKENAVRLMAVSKYVDTERMAEAVAAGVTLFGENRAQELHEKQTFFEKNACTVHFIGQLQTNKIKYVYGCADTVESVDRIALAEGLSARARAAGRMQDIMLQVNIGSEAQKGGAAEDDLASITQQVLACGCLRITGLMCVPPALPAEEARPYFARMRDLLDMLKSCFPDQPLCELSMGMSHDYEAAIEEGATIVRVGTGMFGARRLMA